VDGIGFQSIRLGVFAFVVVRFAVSWDVLAVLVVQ
jgi:hypothetical protein